MVLLDTWCSTQLCDLKLQTVLRSQFDLTSIKAVDGATHYLFYLAGKLKSILYAVNLEI